MRSIGATTLLAILCIVVTTLYLAYHNRSADEAQLTSAGSEMVPAVKPDLSGGVIAGRMGNETTRYGADIHI